ncbi:MAG: hypothetical protein KAX28_08480 [Candidatus Marinimicrobia bacterium]|nr:hypothetical protein [Candidatus Neomarinimicrobiota bacterium]
MKKYRVNLERIYSVEVQAKDAEMAKEVVEYFIGNPKDESSDTEKSEYHFLLGNIEMMYNDSFEVEEVSQFS